MYKVIMLLKAAGSLDFKQLTERWVSLPWSEIGSDPASLLHVHNRGIPGAMPIENAPAATFDAIDEFWFVDEQAARGWFTSQAFRQFWRTHCAPLLADEPLTLSGTPHLLWDRDVVSAPDPVKIITLPVRRDGMTMDDFSHHWTDVHSQLALKGPGTRERLQRLEPCPRDDADVSGFPRASFDGAGTIEFSDRRDLQKEFESEHYRTVMAPDEPRFTNISKSSALMVDPFIL